MPSIKFSHEYDKMRIGACIPAQARILQIIKTRLSDLVPPFIIYDTTYQTPKGPDHYPLPNADLIIIFLQSEYMGQEHLWTTIRRYTPAKFSYYWALIGKQVDIEITGR